MLLISEWRLTESKALVRSRATAIVRCGLSWLKPLVTAEVR